MRTQSARSVGPGGGHIAAPAARSGLRARASEIAASPWFTVATRSAAILAGMVGLAAIGVHSTLAGAGIPAAIPTAHAAPSVSGVWIAPDPAPTGPSSAAPPASGSSSPETAPPPSGGGVTADGKVILNVATADELTKLPRVGAKRAQAILELRKRLGKFRRPTDLLRVRGIGHKTLKQMLPLLVVDPPGAP